MTRKRSGKTTSTPAPPKTDPVELQCGSCGCRWTDNGDGSVSLYDAEQSPGECCDNAPLVPVDPADALPLFTRGDARRKIEELTAENQGIADKISKEDETLSAFLAELADQGKRAREARDLRVHGWTRQAHRNEGTIRAFQLALSEAEPDGE